MTPVSVLLSRKAKTLLVVTAGILVLGLASCGDDRPEGYSAETKAAMIKACIEDDTDQDLADVCECTYDEAIKKISFGDFADMDRRLGGGDSRLPSQLATIIQNCIRDVSRTRS